VNVHSPSGSRNAALGWSGILLGLAAACWLGLWAFDGPFPAPAGFANYDDPPRRLLRLAHIAAIAVGALNVLFARDLPRLPLSPGWRRAASVAAAAAWFGLAPVLALAAFVPAAKYALPPGALSLTFATLVAAAGAIRAALGGSRHA
jgi:hypothetical protein